jgi:hypothetical protein
MKSVYILFILFIVSCSPAKIKDFENDYTQDLVGKIKSINITNYEYKFLKKDTVNLVKNTLLNFDFNNNVINEKITTEDNHKEYNLIYQKGLLIEKKLVSENRVFSTIYKYDENSNLIEQKEFDAKGIYFFKSQQFDKFHNVIESKSSFANKYKGVTKIEYDYKKRFLITKTTMDTLNLNTVEMIKHFNKNGYIVKSKSTSSRLNNKNFTYEIDNKGNLTTKTFYRNDDTIIEIITFRNTYDKKGNIIMRERFLNGKLIEKNTYDIIYY